MILSKKNCIVILILGFFVVTLTQLSQAQRREITYESLLNQSQRQNIVFDNFTLPSSQKGKVKFVTTFRINYNFLTFKKLKEGSDDKQYFSTAGLSIEIFKGQNNKNKKKDRRESISVEGLETAGRAFWKDTAYANTYEETKSGNRFIEGHFEIDLAPGDYSYILHLTKDNESKEQTSRRQTFKILPYFDKRQGNIVLIDDINEDAGKLTLLNFGNNVYYGKDFYLFVHLPEHRSTDQYNIRINRINISSEEDTTLSNSIYSTQIDNSAIQAGVVPVLKKINNELVLDINRSENGADYMIHKIPNSEFENAVYRITVSRKGRQVPIAQSIFRSRWIDMPASLLNLDVAIEMLKFIESKEKVDQLKSGSPSEQEKKFRAFWKKRDPTPDSEFNELMAEYYKRIDQAYEKFSTINVRGFNTDQGKIYIQYGPPDNIERKFPPGEPAVEIWTYNKQNRRFIFRAVSGFGEFELVRNSR